MTRRYYCTYFDRNYLVRGVSLIFSLNRHEKNFTIFVVCLDELTRIILDKLDLQNVVLVPLHELEHGDLALSVARHNRSVVEYYWTLTPSIIHYLIIKYRLAQLTYLDSDLFFFSSPDPIFQEFGSNSVMIHGHRFSESKKYLDIHGIYNVGLLIFKNDENGISCLKWWRDRCNEWCYARVEDGKFADQLYLNHFPALFEKVHVLEHVGAGIAPWNHEQYRVTKHMVTADIFVDDYQLVFYHFHSLKFSQPNIIFPIMDTQNYDIPQSVIELCYLPYLYTLHESIALVWNIMGNFHYGLYDNTIYNAPMVATQNLHADIMDSTLKSTAWCPLDGVWNCYNIQHLV